MLIITIHWIVIIIHWTVIIIIKCPIYLSEFIRFYLYYE